MTGSPPITGGLVVLAALAGWVLLSTAATGADWDAAAGTAALVGAIGVTFVGARRAARAFPWLPAAGVIGVAIALALASPGSLLESPESGPFGYANATAAFYVQTAAAAVLLTATTPRRSLRAAALVTALLAAAIPLANGSLAGAVLVAVVMLGMVGLIWPRWGHGLVIAAGLGFCVVLIATLALGARDAAARSDDRRIVLWHEAVEVVVDHRVNGVGPGQFAQNSPTARSDRDARWAHHEFLELAAEAGLPALALALTAVLWGFRLLVWAPPGPASIGAMALAAFAIHACVDYVAHFPAVPLATAAVVGAASAPRRERSTTVPPCTGGP